MSIRACFVAALLTWQAGALANGDAACQPPKLLQQRVGETYQGYSVVSEGMLRARDRKLFRAEHKSSCPGFVRFDFYGTGARTYGLSLAKREEKRVVWKLLVATATAADGWQIREVDEATNLVAPPAIWSEPPGKYEDVHGKEVLQAKHPVLLAVQYQAWAIAYAWTGEQVSKVWVAD